MLEVTEDFILKTDSSAKEARANNPNSKKVVEKSITAYKNLFENLKSKPASITDKHEREILQQALQYSEKAINQHLTQLESNQDPMHAYAESAFSNIFSEREGTHLDLNH